MVEHGTGRTVTWRGRTIEPLGYNALASIKNNRPVTIPVTCQDAEILSGAPPSQDDQRYTVRFNLESVFSSKSIGLVTGGWLPSGLAAMGRTLLTDRNIVSELRERFAGGSRRDTANDDFLDLLSERTVKINPLLYAMEGNKKRRPTPEEVEEQYRHACRTIQESLPNAIIDPEDGAASLRGAVGILRDSYAGMQDKTKFLQSVVPLLCESTPATKRTTRWARILSEADACGIRRRSLVVLTALSGLACSQGQNPAKSLLKPKRDYSSKDAYNALCDLVALELLIACVCLFPAKPVTLLTCDRNLALLWVGLDPHDLEWNPAGRCTFNVSLDSPLLPHLSEQERESLCVEP